MDLARIWLTWTYAKYDGIGNESFEGDTHRDGGDPIDSVDEIGCCGVPHDSLDCHSICGLQCLFV